MHPLRFIALSFFLFPLFALAQAATTTDPGAELQKQIDALIEERLSQIPSAADIRTGAIGDYLNVTTNPKNPAPNEMVHIKIESYLADLNKAVISWTKNGTTVIRGTGKTTLDFKNGTSGETTRIGISIMTNAGEFITKELSFRPAGVTLLWEADTYTPPFYRGKPLMSAQARVRAIAVSDTTLLDAGNMSYVWKKDGEAVPSASGYGKNSFTFMAPKPFGKADVSVEASSLSDTIKSEVRLRDIPITNPFILFYENHPLLGVWQNMPLGSDISITKKEFSVSAVPFFFSRDSADTPSFIYDWRLNSRTIQNPGTTITLRNEQGGEGDSLLALGMRGINQTFQSGNQSLLIHFAAEAPQAF